MKKHLLLRIIVITFIFFSSFKLVFANTIKIVIPAETELQGEKIFLGDIAKITGDSPLISQLKSLEIKKSPLPGYYINISCNEIEILLKQKGFDLSSIDLEIPKNFKVTRSSQKISGKDLENKAIEFLREHITWNEKNVTITPESQIPDLIVPPGEVKLLPSCSQNTNFIGNSSIIIEVFVNNVSTKKVCATVNVKVNLDVIVAKRDIKSGEILSSDIIEIQNREITQFNRDALTSQEQIKDKVALTGIKTGTIITEKLITSPVIVHQGDRVYIIAKAGSLEVRAIGKARQNGKLGDTISVVNIDSGKILQGIVIESGSVLINLR